MPNSIMVDPVSDYYGAKEVLEPVGIPFCGRIINKISGEPVSEFEVFLTRRDRSDADWYGDPFGEILRERIEDEDGRFSFHLASGGEMGFRVIAHGFLTYEDRGFYLPPDKGLTDLVIEVLPGARVSGRVVEERTGIPVEGALVVQEDEDRGIFLGIDESRQPVARTNAKGRFSIVGLKKGPNKMRILAIHPAFAIGWDMASDGDEEIEIRLAKGVYVYGMVRDDGGTPISGITIHPVGKSNPITRPAVTDADGRYRTPPLRSGTIRLTARVESGKEEWWGEAEEAGFTQETKKIELQYEDMEVNFGPAADHITWSGILYGPEGKPSPGTNILICCCELPDRYSFARVAGNKSDREGKFIFRKLRPGDFFVNLRFPSLSAETQIGVITLGASGPMERDLYIPGGLIRGIVVDEAGEPISSGVVTLQQAWNQGQTSSRSFGETQCGVSQGGEFCLIGVKPGRYSLEYRVGYWSEYVHRMFDPLEGSVLEVAEGQCVDAVRFIIPHTGTIKLRGTGFQVSDSGRVQAEITKNEDQNQNQENPNCTTIEGLVDSRGDLRYTTIVETGIWNVKFIHDNGGSFERVIQVMKNRTSQVTVDRKDFGKAARYVTLAGILQMADGTPVAGRQIRFEKICGELSENNEMRNILSDPEGKFECDFSTGRWDVSIDAFADRIQSRGYGRIKLPIVVVPEGANDPFFIRLVLPSGRVACRISAAQPANLLADSAISWSVFLLEAETGKQIAAAHFIRKTDTMLDYIKPGEYRLRVELNKFLPWQSERFAVYEGGTSDLGSITLTPSGLVDMEVLDADGKPVEDGVQVILIGAHAGQVLFPCKNQYGRVECAFPAGFASALVKVKGFKDALITTKLEQNEVEEVRVILERE